MRQDKISLCKKKISTIFCCKHKFNINHKLGTCFKKYILIKEKLPLRQLSGCFHLSFASFIIISSN